MSSSKITDYKQTIIDALEVMSKKEVAAKEPNYQFKVRAYKKVVEQLKLHSKPITSYNDVQNIEGIGAKISLKIKEILETGSLKAAEKAKKDYNIGAYDSFLNIYGVGPVKAKELINLGITTIEQLRTDPTKYLNEKQQLGLKYYEDLLERIPRSEMLQHEGVLLTALPNFLKGQLVGSFRRNATTSGDIDVIIRYPNSMSHKTAQAAFDKYILNLTKEGYIKEILAHGEKKCMAICCLPVDSHIQKAHRLDLLLTSEEEYPYAVLYFTGSDKFNVAFRQFALDNGYTLNEHKMTPIKKGVMEPLNITEEEDIFNFLGLAYVEPWQRISADDIKEV
jgi:DNA polymerase beta